MVKLLLWLCLLMPVGVWADYFNPGDITDSSFGIIPYSVDCQLDTSMSFSGDAWVKTTNTGNMIFWSNRDTTSGFGGVGFTSLSGKPRLDFTRVGVGASTIYHFPKIPTIANGNLYHIVFTHIPVGAKRDTGAVKWWINGVPYPDSIVTSGVLAMTTITSEMLSLGARYGTAKKQISQLYYSGNLYGVSIDKGTDWRANDPKVLATTYNPMLYNGQVRHHWPLINEDGKAVDYIQDIGYGPKLVGRMYTVKNVAVPTLGGTTVGKAVPIFIPQPQSE